MWRSSLKLAARHVLQNRHRQFKIRRNPPATSVSGVEFICFRPNVVKHLAFATGSSCLLLSGVAIYEYETFDPECDNKEQTTTYQKIANQHPLLRMWNRLSPVHKQYGAILTVNAVIFAMWKVPRLAPIMSRYFARSPTSTLVTPMLLSVFSHNRLLLLSCNMVILFIFSEPAMAVLDSDQFFVTYLTAGVVSSVASHFFNCFRKIPAISMGAGGAVLSMVGIVSAADPEAQLYISFLPMLLPPFICSISYTLKALVLVDIIGLAMKWKFFDHAAHIAGVLFGLSYLHKGHQVYFWYLNHFENFWRRIRSGGEDS